MTRALGPRAPVNAGNAAGMWWVLALCWGLFALGRVSKVDLRGVLP